MIEDGWGTKTTVLNARNTTFLEQVEEEQVEAEWWREQDGLGATVEPSNSMVEEHTMKGDQPAQTVPQYGNHCDQALVSTQEMGSRGDEQHSAGNDEKEHLEGTEIITIEENNSGGGNNVVIQKVVSITSETALVMRNDVETTLQRCHGDDDDDEDGGTRKPSGGDDEQHLVRESTADTRGGTNSEGGRSLDDGNTCIERGGDDETREGNTSMEQSCMVKKTDDVMMNTTPSVGDVRMNGAHDIGSTRECGELTKCVINEERRCAVHNCGTRTTKVTSSKWVKNKKTGLYVTRSVKVPKLICVERNGGLESPSRSTPTRTRAGKSNIVGRALKIFGNLENTENVEK